MNVVANMKDSPLLTLEEKQDLIKKNNRCSFSRHMGIVTLDLAYGYAKTKLKITRKHLNVHQILHGGVILSLADQTASAAGTTMGRKALALQINVNFLASAKMKVGETIYSEARFIREGRKIVYLEMEVCSDKGELISKAALMGMKFDENQQSRS